MQVKEAIKALAILDMDEEICFLWQRKPDDIDRYTWGWITDKFSTTMLRNRNDTFCQAIYDLKEKCPFIPKVASGDVVFVEKK